VESSRKKFKSTFYFLIIISFVILFVLEVPYPLENTERINDIFLNVFSNKEYIDKKVGSHIKTQNFLDCYFSLILSLSFILF